MQEGKMAELLRAPVLRDRQRRIARCTALLICASAFSALLLLGAMAAWMGLLALERSAAIAAIVVSCLFLLISITLLLVQRAGASAREGQIFPLPNTEGVSPAQRMKRGG